MSGDAACSITRNGASLALYLLLPILVAAGGISGCALVDQSRTSTSPASSDQEMPYAPPPLPGQTQQTAAIDRKSEAESLPEIVKTSAENPPTLDDLEVKAEQWFYGPGVGRTMTNVGSVVLFPPYALYLLGNAALSLSGLEPLYITDALPEDARKGVLEVYDEATSWPGQLNSAIAGREYPEKK